MKFEDYLPFAEYDTKLKFVICKELPKNPRVTTCCKKHICFECWKLKFRAVWKPDWKFLDQHYCLLGCSAIFHTDGRNFEVFLKTVSIKCKLSSRWRDVLLKNQPTELTLDFVMDLMVICPDENCKVSLLKI